MCRARWAAWMLAALLAAGCEDGTGPAPAEVLGTYQLVSVNGQALPAPLPIEGEISYLVTQGHLILRADGEFFEARQTRITRQDGSVTTGTSITEGSFSVLGSGIEFDPRDAGAYGGQVIDGTITYSRSSGSASITFTWRK